MSTDPLATLVNEAMRDYARLLLENGFTVSIPSGPRERWFAYSREVEGQTLSGHVQFDKFDGPSHSMPIRPSREHGSSMWVEGVEDDLSLESALAITRPFNWNPLVGTHSNHHREASYLTPIRPTN